MLSKSVVVTGIGVVSPIGIGTDEFWESLSSGKSGVRLREDFSDTDGPFRIAAPVVDFVGKKYIKPRKAIKIMCQPIQFGCAAAMMAAEQAGLSEAGLAPERIGTVFGTETFFADAREVSDIFRRCIESGEYQHDLWGQFINTEIEPLWMLKYLPNMVASHISIALDARGPSNSICQGEASGLLAIIEAASLIERGWADVVIAGGTGSRMTLNSVLYRGTDALSQRPGDPAQASRPFDADRDGMVVGEGAGALVLESREHAERRGATPIAELVGWARTHAPIGDPQMAARIQGCLGECISKSGMGGVGSLGHVNAHGAGAIDRDVHEGQAIQAELPGVPVVAMKGNFGNLGPGTSVIETAGSILALSKNELPRTLNFDRADERLGELNVVNGAETKAGQSFLKSSLSFSGQVASIILRSPL